jgi:hypothetical protein
MYKQMQTNCVKLQIICVRVYEYTETLLHVFAINHNFWIDVNARKYKINVSNVNSQCQEMNNSSYIYENVPTVDRSMLSILE